MYKRQEGLSGIHNLLAFLKDCDGFDENSVNQLRQAFNDQTSGAMTIGYNRQAFYLLYMPTGFQGWMMVGMVDVYKRQFFGCQYIVSSIGEAHLANKAVADDDEVARCVASLIPMLEENNLILVLETHGKEHGTGEKLARIVRKIGSPRVKLNYDTANVIFYGGVDPVQDLKTCKMCIRDSRNRADSRFEHMPCR